MVSCQPNEAGARAAGAQGSSPTSGRNRPAEAGREAARSCVDFANGLGQGRCHRRATIPVATAADVVRRAAAERWAVDDKTCRTRPPILDSCPDAERETPPLAVYPPTETDPRTSRAAIQGWRHEQRLSTFSRAFRKPTDVLRHATCIERQRLDSLRPADTKNPHSPLHPRRLERFLRHGRPTPPAREPTGQHEQEPSGRASSDAALGPTPAGDTVSK